MSSKEDKILSAGCYDIENLQRKVVFSVKASKTLIRLVCLLLICFLFGSVASASTVDLSSFTDEEIISLLTQVNEELVKRNINKTATLPEGAYIAGKDLPAGKYIYTCLATGEDWGNLTVYSDGGKGKQILWNVVSAPENGADPETVFLTLNEGDELKSGTPFSLTIMSGAIFQ